MTPIAKLPLITKPIICYVTDRASLPAGPDANREELLLERIRGAAAAGVDWIELREKDLDSRPLLNLTRKALLAARSGDVSGRENIAPLLLLNDRLDVARVAGADGIHLTEKSLPVSAVSMWRRSGLDDRTHSDLSGFLIGASCHSLERTRQTASDGADYIFFGPVFVTPSKTAFGAPQGLARLAEICCAVKIPVLAIGGVTAENAAACIEAGASGVAAIGLFQRASDPAGLVTELRAKFS